MKQIVSIINQKGGVGKSTTSQALAAGLSLKGYKVLLIDMDSQGNLSFSVGANKQGVSVLEVLKREASAEDSTQHIGALDIIPASISLAGADMQLTEMGKEYRLKEAIEPIKKRYDYIIIDTPPALGILTINALTASDSVIIPAQADIYSIDAIGQLYSTIRAVQQYTNRDLMINGILLTRFSDRTVLSRDLASMIQNTADQLGTRLFKSTIREAISIKEAQASKADIFAYAPKSKVAADYMGFVDEFLSGAE
jgi:chromosome partitioning protein